MPSIINYNLLIITQGDNQKTAWDISTGLYTVPHADYGENVLKIPSHQIFHIK